MTERQLQFRVGVFVILALLVAGWMAFQFSDLKSLWEPRYALVIHFDSAPGVYRSTPVRRNGIAIGAVSGVLFDEKQGGVLVVVEIQQKFRLRHDARPHLVRTLLGDSSIDFTPGKSRKFLQPGSKLHGQTPSDPIQIVQRLEKKLTTTMAGFSATSHEWKQVGRNLNNLLETNHGNLNVVVERAAAALHQFTVTMQTAEETLAEANELLASPQNQENMRKTLAALPELVEETKQTIQMVRLTVKTAGENLENLKNVTAPLGKRTASIVAKLDGTMTNLESLSRELNDFTKILAKRDGSVQKFVTDPELYRNMNRSASSLALLLKNMEPIVRDLRIFSDKVARHPELIGLGGAMKGSSGLKDLPATEVQRR